MILKKGQIWVTKTGKSNLRIVQESPGLYTVIFLRLRPIPNQITKQYTFSYNNLQKRLLDGHYKLDVHQTAKNILKDNQEMYEI